MAEVGGRSGMFKPLLLQMGWMEIQLFDKHVAGGRLADDHRHAAYIQREQAIERLNRLHSDFVPGVSPSSSRRASSSGSLS